jgi:caffeoyl-CoA O-methyltransferase
MSFVVPEDIERYAEAHTTPHAELLQRLAEETRATLERPQMLTGTIEGRFLEFLVYATGARRILELGTYSGYGSISMAAGLRDGGRIDTCEVDEQHVHLGPALETISRLEGDFDFVFIDADKENYVNYYEAVLPRMSERGLIAADNTLWSGRVVDESEQDESTRAIRAFNDQVANDKRVVCVMLSVRDGVTLIRRR